MIKEKNSNPNALVLRFMREKRKLTLLTVGKKIGIRPKIIDHIENGHNFLTDKEIQVFLECYNFSFEIFSEMTQLKPLNKKAVNIYFLSRKIF